MSPLYSEPMSLLKAALNTSIECTPMSVLQVSSNSYLQNLALLSEYELFSPKCDLALTSLECAEIQLFAGLEAMRDPEENRHGF